MDTSLTFQKSITINAPISDVWNALTNPALIKQYLFGTETITDWKKGSSIVFQGVWQDKPYVDKGIIVDIKPERFLQYTYWSSFSGIADVPENYSTITYSLTEGKNTTEFILKQVGFTSPETRDHSAANWAGVMESIKKIVEEMK